MAPTALLATLTACLMIMFRESIDVKDDGSCYFNNTGTGDFDPEFPSVDFVGFGEGNYFKGFHEYNLTVQHSP